MGNHRFKLSDMIPNAWFYKLKDMSRSRKRNGFHAMKNKPSSPTTSQRSQARYSNYFPTEPNRAGKLYNSPIFTKGSQQHIPSSIDSPRRSSKRRSRRKTIYYKPSSPTLVSSSSECDDSSAAPDFFNGLPSNCSCRVSSSTNDIIIDMNNGVPFTGNSEKLDGFETISELDLPPILTKPLKFDEKSKLDKLKDHHQSVSVKNSKKESSESEELNKTQRERKSSAIARKSSAGSTGIRLRVNSPKLASRKVQGFAARRGASSRNTGFPEGFAVVKSSFDPQRDFRDSMVEMIMENNIRSSKDLEDLLACYLSLNSSEYHELIVKAFEQIWFDMAQLKL
ncbi:transcription repressor OFP4-like [Senna tora]|uniref:Transcription repressor n=1 Tax=Senna tora TaxID=362788 RepID=A0A834WXP4_9FABA|nr:transcription repressor OFP4-like [Senna tora]